MEEASIAHAEKPCCTNECSAACKVTGSGVVRPVGDTWAFAPTDEPTGGGSPTPKVPTTPQRSPKAVSACAIHQAVEVLPLVPVAATIFSSVLGSFSNKDANTPVFCFSAVNVATLLGSIKRNALAPSASTKQATAPPAQAASTKRRPSVAYPGQAMKALPACTCLLSAHRRIAPCACSQASASSMVDK